MINAAIVINGASTRQRVLAAIRQLFRDNGYPPSHDEIAQLAGIATKRVQRYVEMLAAEGFLTYRKRVARSILLINRGAMLSDAELRLANAERSWTIVESPLRQFGDVYKVEVATSDPDADLIEQLATV